jgi:lipopolysaccharide export system protein LptC
VAAVKEPFRTRVLNRASAWFPVLLLASLAGLTYWLDQQVTRGERPEGTQAKDPDYYVEDFAATRFGSDGRVIQQLAATRLTHYPDGSPTEVVAPQLVTTQPAKPRMRVRADSGKISADNEQLYLMGNVVGVREATPGQGQVTVTTEYLHVRVRDEKADTDKRVTITDATGTHVGNAMEADNKSRILKLRNGVSGEIEVKNR